MTHIAVVGSANVDLIAQVPHLPKPGETVIGTAFEQAMGGKGANQAVAAARLGAQVTFIARLGDDRYADTCLASYSAAGIHTEAIQHTRDTPTGIAMIGVADDGENNIIVVSGANAHLSPEDVRAAGDRIRAADALLVQLESPLETVQAAVNTAYEHGKTIILNPAPFRKLPPKLLQKISVLTPNLTEAEQLIGGVLADDETLAKRVLGTGVQSAVITLGAKGALAAGSWGFVRLPAYEVSALDTTGAGDAFSAGLAVALGENMNLEQAARFAMAAAALSVTKLGAQPSMPTRNEVDTFLDK